ncbi:MAG: hypothetical protein A2152_02095 [Candidatus Levybacteria bacterium RBG_16_35_6]|nr:MAG: hypothetical protein A2152_02095 [Candidatus Levybacteria bacterium RBG_16_35_6]
MRLLSNLLYDFENNFLVQRDGGSPILFLINSLARQRDIVLLESPFRLACYINLNCGVVYPEELEGRG